jgi:hypothetical protein
MNRIFLLLTLFAVVGFSGVAQEVAAPARGEKQIPVDPVDAALAALDAGNVDEAELKWVEISNPAAKIFVQAGIARARGNLKSALEMLAGGVVLYPHNSDWIAKSELMMVVLYMESGMLDAADVTARQVQVFHEGTDAAKNATALRSDIERLKKETELEGSIK